MRGAVATPRVGGPGRIPVVAGISVLLFAIASALAAGRAPVLAIGGVLGLVFVCILLANLTVGVCAFIVVQFFATLPGASGQELTVIKIAGAVLVMGWVVTLTSTSERRLSRSFLSAHPVICAALVAFVLWGFLGLLWAPASDLVIDSTQRYALNFLLVAIIFTAIRSRRDLALVAGALAIGGALAAIGGILFVDPTAPGRLRGTVGHSNNFAAAMVPVVIVSTALAWSERERGKQALYGAAAIASVAGLVLSLSRLGFVALPAAFIVWAVFGGRWRARIVGILCIGAAIATAVFLLAAPAAERGRVFQNEDGGSGRSDIWTVAIRTWQEHPITGVGLGNYNEVAPEQLLRAGRIDRTDLIIDKPQHAHNMYLGLLAETGVVGTALILTIIVGALLAAWQAARIFLVTGHARSEALARALLAAQAGILIAGMFLYTQYEKSLWILTGLSLAALAVALSTQRDADAPLAIPLDHPDFSDGWSVQR